MRRGLLLGLMAATLLAAAPAHAAFPGRNGDFAYAGPSVDINNNEIFTVPADGGGMGVNRTQLTTGGGFKVGPAWSPDGQQIAYRGNDGGVWVMDADGSNQHPVRGSFNANPAWSHDGEWLIFDNGVFPGNRPSIYRMRAAGGPDQLVTQGSDPDWSPDGELIAYECGLRRICTATPSGGGVQLIGPGFDPEWSPDGSQIAVSDGGEFDGNQIWVMNRDGSDRMQLTNSFSLDNHPVWSPDGRMIAFNSDRHHGPRQPPAHSAGLPGIWVMDADGSDPRLLVFIGYTFDWQSVSNRPPDCEGLSASPDLLWPPNRRLRLVSFSGATDPEGDSVALNVVSVTQDEPVRGPGDPTRPDARPGGQEDVLLRAERAPRGDGRVYRVEISATDAFGGGCRKTVKVTVPRKKNIPAVESPESYDSFGR